MRRLLVLCSACLLVLSALVATPVEVGGMIAAGIAIQKKKGIVDGAIWRFIATARDGKQIAFKYRAADLVLFDVDTGEEISKSEPLGPKRSRVTFNDSSKFPATFEIVHAKKMGENKDRPVWKGNASFQDKDWTIQLVGLVN